MKIDCEPVLSCCCFGVSLTLSKMSTVSNEGGLTLSLRRVKPSLFWDMNRPECLGHLGPFGEASLSLGEFKPTVSFSKDLLPGSFVVWSDHHADAINLSWKLALADVKSSIPVCLSIFSLMESWTSSCLRSLPVAKHQK